MSKLLSIAEVRELWPDPKPTEKALKRLAKSTGCCRKLGRAIGFTESDVQQLLSACCDSPETKSHRTGMSVARSPDAAYAKALELVNAHSRRHTEENVTPNYTLLSRLARKNQRHGAKR
jgi:hypothetical protein